MFAVAVDPEFHGPTLDELEPILEDLPSPIEVRWTGSATDYLLLERHHRDRRLLLKVADQDLADRTLWTLGGKFPLGKEAIEAAKKALTNQASQTWRADMDRTSPTRGSLLLIRVVGDSLRSGKKPQAAMSIARDCLFQGVNPADADVLMRLRTGRR